MHRRQSGGEALKKGLAHRAGPFFVAPPLASAERRAIVADQIRPGTGGHDEGDD